MGGNYVKNPNILDTATKVAKKCGGLPVALMTVSRAFKNKNLPQWKEAEGQLTRLVPGQVLGMLREVYMPIELSYEHLECEEFKSIFLLCALMAYNIHFWDLLKYCHGIIRHHPGGVSVTFSADKISEFLGIAPPKSPSYPDQEEEIADRLMLSNSELYKLLTIKEEVLDHLPNIPHSGMTNFSECYT
ncbi:hypothetical protein CJ030_MR3G022804 [Morella rubra]|uniref:Uncharacterized protein n=1 Tax=Morella rubra TaxID=262757 RepID=A0A6A1W418_9ROSI|nr:hypothetical protein CJ030_MR3G022804 [Morella rubra]